MFHASLRRQICEIGRRMYSRGYCAANDGNISVRLPGERVLCTPSGVSKGFMTPEALCVVDRDGRPLRTGRGFRPSSEIKMHLRVYAERPDVSAVVHAHPPYATAHAVAGVPLMAPVLPEAVIFLGVVPLAGYGAPSTEEVPEAVGEYVRQYDAMLLANHGALSYGTDLEQAYFRMESLEFYAQVLYLSNSLGGPKPLSGEQVAKLRALRESASR